MRMFTFHIIIYSAYYCVPLGYLIITMNGNIVLSYNITYFYIDGSSCWHTRQIRIAFLILFLCNKCFLSSSNGTVTTKSEVSPHKLFGLRFCGSNHSSRVLSPPPLCPFCWILLRCGDLLHDNWPMRSCNPPCGDAVTLPQVDQQLIIQPSQKDPRHYHSHLIKTCQMKYVSFHCSRHKIYCYHEVNKLTLPQVLYLNSLQVKGEFVIVLN